MANRAFRFRSIRALNPVVLYTFHIFPKRDAGLAHGAHTSRNTVRSKLSLFVSPLISTTNATLVSLDMEERDIMSKQF